MKELKKNDALKAIPLGGHGEIGKNCWAFEYKDEILVVNYGMMLPGKKEAGIDIVMPNATYLKENESKIKGLIITSAHDDSCGGAFYLLDKVKIPKVWGSKLALNTLKASMKKGTKLPEIEELKPREEFTVGEQFKVKPIVSTFSIPNVFGLYIKSPTGNVLYTGSFKIDQLPIDNVKLDYFSFAQAGEDGVDLLISDSTDVEIPGYCQSENKITKRFNEIFRDSESRVIVVTNACDLFKIQLLLKIAKKNKKKVFISGDYINNKIKVTTESGFFSDEGVLVKDIKDVKDKDLVIITSGKQGNFLPALIEMANEEHDIKLNPKDTIVTSANPPHGTTRILAHTVDQLYVQKVQVIGGRNQGVHVASHAPQEEAKFMLSVTKPKAFAPSHGEERQQVIHGEFAEAMGINHNDIHIVENGEIIEVRDGVSKVAGKVPGSSIFYNTEKGIDIDENTMKERQALSSEGTVTVALSIDSDGKVIAGPEIFAEACSFAKGKDWRAFCIATVEIIKSAIKESVDKDEKDLQTLKTIVRDTVNKNVLELIARRPLINVSIQEIKAVKA